MLHDAVFMKVNVLDALNFNTDSQTWVSHMATVDCYHKCGFNLNQSSDSEDIQKIA